MAGTLQQIELKFAEADFFLNRMAETRFEVFAFYCYFSGYTSAARSTTFTLQSVMGHEPGFAEWYAGAQEELRRDPLARFFVERRNLTQKQGSHGVTGGSLRQGEVKHFFDGVLADELPAELRKWDVLSAAKRHMGLLVHVGSSFAEWYEQVARIDQLESEMSDERWAQLLLRAIEPAPDFADLARKYPYVPYTGS